MDEVFAPWRMDWVRREPGQEEGCVFCDLAEVDDDRDHRVLARSESSYAVLNISPYNTGHTLIIPEEHADDYVTLDRQALTDVHLLVQATVGALETALHPDGFNIGMNLGAAGGASVEDHLHVHVVPRWERDTTFMPTTANTQIIVEALDETYDRVRSAFVERENADLSDDTDAVPVTT